MRVLVAGATGLVGSAVVRALRSHGHEVWALVRDPRRLTGDLVGKRGPPIQVIRGEMCHPASYVRSVRLVDAVVQAAHPSPWGWLTRGKIAAMHAADRQMALALAEACLRHRRRLIYTSGALTHAGYPARWIDESLMPRPCLLARGHAETSAELLASHSRDGLDVVVVSPGMVYGPAGLWRLTAEYLRAGRYRIVGRGDNFWSLVEADDLGEAFARALEYGRGGENYFVADGQSLTRREVIAQLCAALGVAYPGHVPTWLARLGLGAPLVESLEASVRVDGCKAQRELGWRPQHPNLAAGLPGVVAQLRQAWGEPSPGRPRKCESTIVAHRFAGDWRGVTDPAAPAPAIRM